MLARLSRSFSAMPTPVFGIESTRIKSYSGLSKSCMKAYRLAVASAMSPDSDKLTVAGMGPGCLPNAMRTVFAGSL